MFPSPQSLREAPKCLGGKGKKEGKGRLHRRGPNTCCVPTLVQAVLSSISQSLQWARETPFRSPRPWSPARGRGCTTVPLPVEQRPRPLWRAPPDPPPLPQAWGCRQVRTGSAWLGELVSCLSQLEAVPSQARVPGPRAAAARLSGWPEHRISKAPEMVVPVLLCRHSPVSCGELHQVVFDVFPCCLACHESRLLGPGRIPALGELPHLLEPQFPLLTMVVVAFVCESEEPVEV